VSGAGEVPKVIRVEIDLMELVNELVEQLSVMLKREGVDFKVDFFPDRVVFTIDVASIVSKMVAGGGYRSVGQGRVFRAKVE